MVALEFLSLSVASLHLTRASRQTVQDHGLSIGPARPWAVVKGPGTTLGLLGGGSGFVQRGLLV